MVLVFLSLLQAAFPLPLSSCYLVPFMLFSPGFSFVSFLGKQHIIMAGLSLELS